MKTEINNILNRIQQIEHGFQHINSGADEMLAMFSKEQCFDYACQLFKQETYQARMLATAILGRLAAENNDALSFLKKQVSIDENWRVQEMLAKAFDEVCKNRGYEMSLPLIKEWLNDDNPNVIRAVTEGLRIWTSRPFFKENPSVAIELISKHKAHENEYLRKSVRNALKDIGKKHKGLVLEELNTWDLSNPLIQFTHKHAIKQLDKKK
ncbi:DNA alkylation repair enzyme [Porphyromonas macacae]|uniref:DNA alkylation repair enzyme n=1 Tax=Porphyromonas macacae TaxID=28115 RepID=A0A379EBH6_9PORP|nr:DNA alkylation repair protein [Porphyromonas macacae]SUB89731.1 DNA alkylation repair enzyme [Porphyromonas macacae]